MKEPAIFPEGVSPDGYDKSKRLSFGVTFAVSTEVAEGLGNFATVYRSDGTCNVVIEFPEPLVCGDDARHEKKRQKILQYIGVPVLGPAVWGESCELVREAETTLRLTGAAEREIVNARGLACRVKDSFGDVIRFIVDEGTWIIFDGKRWSRDKARPLMKGMIGQVTDDWREEDNDKEHRRKVSGLEHTAGVNGVFLWLEKYESLHCRSTDFNTNGHLFNFLNGTVNAKPETEEEFFRPHRASDMITTLCALQYNPDAKCPEFLRAHNRLFGDAAEFAQKVMGYSVFGGNEKKTCTFLWGPKHTGKTQYMNAIAQTIGFDYFGVYPPGYLTYKGPKQQPSILHWQATNKDKHLLLCSETDPNVNMDEQFIKANTGGGYNAHDGKYQKGGWSIDKGTLVLDTNHLPRLSTDEATWARIILFDVNHATVPEHERIDNWGASTAAEEGEGIAAFLMAGARLAFAQPGWGQYPPSVQNALDAYHNREDYLCGYLAERTKVVPGSNIPCAAAYEDFKGWCAAQNKTAYKSDVVFNREVLRILGPKGVTQDEYSKQNTQHFIGLAWANAPERTHAPRRMR